jgi:hypothetical protein
LAVGDDDTIDEEFDQLSALGKRQIVQRRVNALAKCLDPLCQSGAIHLLLRLRLDLAQLLGQAVLGLGHLLTFALELVTADHFGQVHLQQPGLLAFELGQGLTERFLPGLECLGEPGAPLGPCQFVRDEHGRGQETTEVLPHHVV